MGKDEHLKRNMRGNKKMNRIDKIRKRKVLSYGKIAKNANISSKYVYLLAKGKRKNPSYEIMQAISDALGEKVQYIFNIN